MTALDPLKIQASNRARPSNVLIPIQDRGPLLSLVKQLTKGSAWDDPDQGEGCAALLALLTYCYATETYPSEEIEHRLGRDHSLRDLYGPLTVDARRIRLFRAQNRPWLTQCLAQVLFQLGHDPGEESKSLGWTGMPSDPRSGRQWRGYRHLCHAEANRRINQAIAADQPSHQ